ncbi:nuclear transport factor 2 family protein [Nocardia sp. NPDC057227]|uniref:nuclear transport factor 2 family protein n=1 Tax=Nocardia sp. NPDC057227 TaxID=3346056 RepID=UPI0036396D4A
MSTVAVTELIARYGELIDAGDFAGVGALFADAAFVSGGHTIRGSAGVEEMLRHTVIRYDDGTPRTHHVTTDVVVEFAEPAGTATARSAITVFQALHPA